MKKAEIEIIPFPEDDFIVRSPEYIEESEDEDRPIKKDYSITLWSKINPFLCGIVKGTSMEPTFHNGQFYSTRPRFCKLKVGEVYLLTFPDIANGVNIKRCVAIEGDVIRYNNNYVKIFHHDGTLSEYGKDDGPCEYKILHLKKKEAFFLGDNFKDSKDSRQNGVVYTCNVFRKVTSKKAPLIEIIKKVAGLL